MSTSTKPSETAESGGFVDVDKSWHPALQLFLESVGSLVFTVDGLAIGTLGDFEIPRVRRVELFLTERLAGGAVRRRNLIAEGTAYGIGEDALDQARRRTGLVATDGWCGLPGSPVGS